METHLNDLGWNDLKRFAKVPPKGPVVFKFSGVYIHVLFNFEWMRFYNLGQGLESPGHTGGHNKGAD